MISPFEITLLVFALIGVVTSVYVGADMLFKLGTWRRDRIRDAERQAAKLKQPRARWS